MITVNKANPTAAEERTSLVNASDGAGLHLVDGGYVDLTNSAAAEYGTSDFSLEFVLNQTEQNSSANYIYFSHTSGPDRFYVRHTGSDTVILTFRDASDSGTQYTINYGLDQNFGTPTHYVLTCNRDGDATLYANGNSVGTVDISGSSSVDIGATNSSVGRIGSTSTIGVLGTFYRFRTWNKALTSAEVQTAYERADVDFADQYGSQTSLVDAGASMFTSGTYSWSAYGSNTIANVGNALEITYVNHASGASNGLRNSADLTTDLTVGKKYRLTVDAKYTGGSAGSKLQLALAGSNTDFATLTTSLVTYTYEFTADTAAGGGLRMSGMSAGNVVTIDNWYLREIGCVSDYELSANPTQSRTVQDRAGSADGTCSASGVTQVQPVVQLNSTSARIGTTAATPADGTVKVGDALTLSGPTTYGFVEGGSNGLILANNSGNDCRILVNDDNSMQFNTSSATRLTIDSSGNITTTLSSANTNTAGVALKLDHTTSGSSAVGFGTLIKFAGERTDSTSDGMGTLGFVADVMTSSRVDGAFVVNTGQDGAYTERMRIASTGQVQIQQDASDQSGASALKVTGTAYGTNKTIEAYMSTGSAIKSLIYAENASGEVMNVRGDGLAVFSGGIAFQSATTGSGTGTGYTLDSYETGTWTPAVGGTWTSNPTSLTGTYTKVGNLVRIGLRFSSGTKASITAGYIDGLPFTIDQFGTGSVTDSSVTDRGNALCANGDRVWLTNNTFAVSTYVTATYTVA